MGDAEVHGETPNLPLLNGKRRRDPGGPTEGGYDPSKPKSLNIVVASSFPPWQDQSVAIAQGAYGAMAGAIDNGKVKDELTKLGSLKDKRVMPFIQMLKVRSSRSDPPDHNLIIPFF